MLDSQALPSHDVLRELHDDLVAQKRRAFLRASPLLLLAGFAAIGAFSDPAHLSGLMIFCAVTTTMIGQVGYEWVALRRLDPLEHYRREQRFDAQQRAHQIAYFERMAAIRPYVSISLVALIIGVSIVEFASGPLMQSVQAAGLVKPATRAGQWWRLLTASYLHGSLFHLLANTNALLILGRLVETYDRRLRVPLVYLAGAIGGCLLSTFADSGRASIGASGGVIALAGYLLVVAGSSAGVTAAWIRKQMLSILASTAVLGVAAFMFIDNAGHLGGAVTGALVGWIVKRIGGRYRWQLDGAGLAAGVVLAAGAVFTVLRLVFAIK